MNLRSGSVSLAVCLLATPAGAHDEVQGTRSEKVYERSHEVRASLHRGYVELRVRRRVENQGARHDQAMFWISTPAGAAATGLKTLGSLGGRPKWFAGELMEAEAAAARYKELTGIGGYYPKDPALLSWRSQGQLLLQVFPVAPKDSKTIEYTLLAPTEYKDGAHRYVLDGLGTPALRAELELAAPSRGDKLLLDGKAAGPGARLTPALDASTELGLVPKTSEPLGGELGVAATGKRFVTHFSVEAAPRVASVPKGAQIVVVLDASRSVPDALLDAQKAAAAAYLSHFRDAEVEVLTFDRVVHRRYGKLVSAERARRDLTALPIEQKNGSAVDQALAEAEKILAGTALGKPRRLVLTSDALVRSALKPERIRAAVGASGAVVHLGVLRDYAVSLSRDDEHAWAPAIRSTGGLVWRAGASDDADDKKQMREVYEEWARPLRVDHLKLYSPDLEVGTITERPELLDEGQGFERLLFTDKDVSWLRVEGELWSKPVRRVIHADVAAGKRWASLVFGSQLLDELSEPEMMKLAMHGGAVSPVTSYLAIEPGVRPSTEGLDWSGGSGQGFGSGLASVRMGATSTSGRARPLDRDKWLRDELGKSFVACGGKPGTASISLETTFAEVVDVTRVELGGLKDPLLERCVTEAAWDLVLPVQFDEEWTTWAVSL
ncbi:MAG: VWA domain-containing protein [Polyangiaceae bacterium]|nr:VWA domain-containing protein [Polyangiaceae bacterium]MCL4750356.1 VWA domain-containing protein [Myxococcales bacterium]